MPVKGHKIAPQVRFSNLYKVDQGTNCWLWIGARSSQGEYPGFTGQNGEFVYAHRMIYEQTYGSIPAKHHIHHKCVANSASQIDHSLCVNPTHLECLSAAEHRERHRQMRQAHIDSRLVWIASLIRNGWDDGHIKRTLDVPLYAIRQVRREIRITSAEKNQQPETAQQSGPQLLMAA